MITSLRLQNFRRHAETELRFDNGQQILLIAGRNGVGKSTLLEAVVYALYGQSRHGRRHLDRLVRRGAELEGMQVELEFSVDQTEYLVRRRRDSKVSTAILYGNSMPLVEGADEVTAEITRILGMDVVGFRLAVIAQQKELDGLASVQPGKRAEMLSRLLRLDAISKARDEARAQFRRTRELVATLGTGEDLPSLRAAVERAEDGVNGASEALDASAQSLTLLHAELAASSAVEAEWMQAQQALATASGRVQESGAEVERLETELAAVHVPAAVEMPSRPLPALLDEAGEVDRAIAHGEAAQRLAEQHAMVATEHGRVVQRLAEVTATIPEGGSTALLAALVTVEADLAARSDGLEREAETLTQLREQYSAARTRETLAAEKLERVGGLGGRCEVCGQEIGEEHRALQITGAEEQLAATRTEAERLLEEGRRAREAHSKAGEVLRQEREVLERRRSELNAVANAETERDELLRREKAYSAQLQRLSPAEVDLDELYARRAELAIAVTAARDAEEAARTREAVLSRRAHLLESLEAAQRRHAGAREALEAASVSDALAEAYARHQATREAIDAETEISRHLTREKIEAEGALHLARAELKRAETALEMRRKREREATVAANAARLLEALEARLKAQIRPALEGAVAEVLAQMSEGRFTSVRFDDQYNISVVDDGKLQPLSEFSGGEADLIALAERVALSTIVSERHGTPGIGALIFDEVFGSQDQGRRSAIMSGLRNLRASYPQIFLISHVGGLEDDADGVIELSTSLDDEGALVAAAA